MTISLLLILSLVCLLVWTTLQMRLTRDRIARKAEELEREVAHCRLTMGKQQADHEELKRQIQERSESLMELNRQLKREAVEREATEASLRRNEALLRKAQEIARLAMWARDPRTDEVFWSDEHFRLLGYEPGAITPTLEIWKSHLHPEDVEKVMEARESAFVDEREPYDIEYRIVTVNGAVKTVHALGAIERDSGGRPVWIYGTTQDITERKRMEEALRRSEEQMRLTVQSVPVMLDALDESDRIIVWNEECERVTGYKAEEILGKDNVWEMLYPDGSYRERMLEEAQRKIGNLWDWEWEITCKDGSKRIIAWSSNSGTHPIPGWHTWAVGIDVTERRQFLDALRLSEEDARKAYLELDQIFNSTADSIMLIDRDCTIVKVNDSFPSLMGVEKDSVLRRKCYDTFPGPFCHKPQCCMVRILEGAERVESQIEKKLKTGKTLFLHQVATPFKNPSGEIIGIVMNLVDITAVKRAETAFWKQQEEFYQAARLVSLGTLVSGVAHEINNPNYLISLNIQLLKEAWQDVMPILHLYHRQYGEFSMGGMDYSEMKEHVPVLLSGASDGSTRIKRIVQALKDYARPETSDMLQPVEINHVVKKAVELLDHLIKKSTEHFSVDLGENIPVFEGNLQRLEQVCVNLIQNACQALTDVEQSIRVATSYDEGNGLIEITVEDEGTGIPTEIRTRIMDPFFTTKRHSGGTGLGLSVSSSIVNEHGGTIAAKSEQGCGSVFTVGIPVVRGGYTAKILVAEDDPMAREVLVQALRKQGCYLVDEADTGIETCLKLKKNRPDLLVLDVWLSDMDAAEVCRRIKSDPSLANMRVLLVTGFPESPKVKELSGMGCVHLCQKPVKWNEFLDMVEELLERGDA